MATGRRRSLFILPLAASVLLSAAWFACTKTRFVDQTPAIRVGDQFFAFLRQDDTAGAIHLYAASMSANPGSAWRGLLDGLRAKFGPVSEARLDRASIVPRGEDPCHLLEYRTDRRGHLQTEKLLLCVERASGALEIVGHEMIRLDTEQKISEGLTVREVGLRFP